MSKNPQWVLVAIAAAIPVATLFDLFQQNTQSVGFLGAACLAFLLKHYKGITIGIQRTSSVLMLLTACLVTSIDQPLAALERGMRIGGLIASLLISVSLMSIASLQVPRMRQVITGLFELPRGVRPLALGVSAQFLGGFLGLAGLTMMMDVAAQRINVSKAEKIADFSAISRGYAALALWSPMYSNMSIVLTMYDGIHWIDVIPYAFTISAMFILLGAVIENFKPRTEDSCTLQRSSVSKLTVNSLPIIALMLCFVAFMVWASNRMHVTISAIVIFSMPVIAWLINVWHPADPNKRWSSGSRKLRKDLIGQSAIAGEVLLFLVSGCAGMVFAQAIPVSMIEPIVNLADGSPFRASLLVMMAIVLLSGTSMHPMLSAILVGSSMTPSLLHVPALMHLCAVLVGWGLAIIITPFSVLSLMASRFSGIPILVISLRANLVFVMVSIGSAAMILSWIVNIQQ